MTTGAAETIDEAAAVTAIIAIPQATSGRWRCVQRVERCGSAELDARAWLDEGGSDFSHFSMATQLSQQSREKRTTKGVSRIL
jgi:hypothetical protein